MRFFSGCALNVRQENGGGKFYAPKSAEKPPKLNVLAVFTGPSDGIRTHGLLVPNQARYQLRYARMYLVIIPIAVVFVKNGAGKVVDKIPARGYNEPKWR